MTDDRRSGDIDRTLPQIPDHWEWASFADVARVASNLVDPALYPDLPHIAPNHIESWTGRLLPFATVAKDGVTSPKHLFEPGQVLYSKIRPYLAKTVLASFEGLCSADMYPIATDMDKSFLAHWLRTPAFTAQATAHQGRSVLPKINQEALNRLMVPVPPLGEQRRIVETIEAALSNLDAGVAYLLAARQRLTRLNEAAAWSSLLRTDEIVIAENGLPVLPGYWDWQTLGTIADVVGGVTKDAKKQMEPGYVEVPYLRVANVQRGWLDLADVTTIRVPPQRAKSLRLESGDVLFNEGGDRDKLGRGWVWEGQIENCIHQNHVFRARIQAPGVQPKYVSLWGNTFGRRWFEHAGKQTTNLASIGMTSLKAFPVPVPPAEEQAAIVAEVEAQQSVVSSTNADIEHQLQRASALRRSVLAAAFSGALVPQNPADEPTEVLLGRLVSERMSAIGEGRKGRIAEGVA